MSGCHGYCLSAVLVVSEVILKASMHTRQSNDVNIFVSCNILLRTAFVLQMSLLKWIRFQNHTSKCGSNNIQRSLIINNASDCPGSFPRRNVQLGSGERESDILDHIKLIFVISKTCEKEKEKKDSSHKNKSFLILLRKRFFPHASTSLLLFVSMKSVSGGAKNDDRRWK